VTRLLALALASPSPEPGQVVDTPPPELITPGTVGFLVTFAVAVAFVFLVRDMARRVRRINVRADVRLREQEGVADGGTAEGGGRLGRPGDAGTGGDDPDGDRRGGV
jgi:hypothetical protein